MCRSTSLHRPFVYLRVVYEHAIVERHPVMKIQPFSYIYWWAGVALLALTWLERHTKSIVDSLPEIWMQSNWRQNGHLATTQIRIWELEWIFSVDWLPFLFVFNEGVEVEIIIRINVSSFHCFDWLRTHCYYALMGFFFIYEWYVDYKWTFWIGLKKTTLINE